MKKLIISALIAVATTAQAQTTIDPYQPMMDAFDKQAEKIMNEFKAIQKKDPKGELPESKEKARILSERLDSLGDAQLEFVKEIIRDNKENDLPVNYIKEAMYQFSYEELKEALSAGADIIMLDNMSCEDMKKAVEITDGRVPLEASGNVTEETIADIAKTGVDIISLGALTHSVKAFDISMRIEK
jgi:hypothetical protein